MKRRDNRQLVDTIAAMVKQTHGVSLAELIADDRRAHIASARRAFVLWCSACGVSVHELSEILHRGRNAIRSLLKIGL